MTEIHSAQMLDAIELFHYASKFRDSRFVIILSEESNFEKITDDIRALLAAELSICIVSTANQNLENIIERMKFRGLELEHFFLKSDNDIFLNKPLPTSLKPCVFSVHKENIELVKAGIEIAKHWNAKRVIKLSESNGIKIKERIKSHLTSKELKTVIKNNSYTHLKKELLSVLHKACEEYGLEFSLLQCEKGNIFKELFTHIGSGTLISADYSSIVRRAENPDILSIYRLLRPNLGSGSILEISEDYFSENIDSFFVYLINDSIVAAAMLKEFGEHNELAKFCTLPRYQGKGKARILAEHIIEQSKQDRKRSVFSLSTVQTMWKLFESLGMKETPRENLPQEWRKDYDLSRPSKAFQAVF